LRGGDVKRFSTGHTPQKILCQSCLTAHLAVPIIFLGLNLYGYIEIHVRK